eukprot:366200-Chlamydomonas_euryale.AAC.5
MCVAVHVGDAVTGDVWGAVWAGTRACGRTAVAADRGKRGGGMDGWVLLEERLGVARGKAGCCWRKGWVLLEKRLGVAGGKAGRLRRGAGANSDTESF